ncbi:MAG: enoyl-CoA hydratase/isomerase [Caballeronia sp.]|jgi:2-(1,2-epoxy-1,2-dihydrophenyl)acetyl-CoA isomerase|uniref:enoyl-CoA hydratase/isomerase family protein n=1 Tax=Caballeronia sp. TaxID=1931223 RepID=UPI00261856D8|nr:enoyl-CoA hydratase/isomerase family protein [Caballeronia sp.]MDB5837701.1 enoyl-CoA hydratase/isomerase [Caballeronia sp.]
MKNSIQETGAETANRTVLVEVTEGVMTLTLNRPERKNALDLAMRRELADAIHTIRADRSIRAVLLKGAGGAFCSGGDLGSMKIDSAEAGRNRLDDLHEWLQVLLTLDRPVVAAVDGVAYGAGFSLALAADYIVASRRARFCMPFIRVGLLPDSASLYTLPRAVGMQRAKDILFSAREIQADEARLIGIAAEVVDADAIDRRASEVAQALAGASPAMIGLTKRALNTSFENDLHSMLERESAGQGIAFMTDYHREAVKRFSEKAAPLFNWPAAVRD